MKALWRITIVAVILATGSIAQARQPQHWNDLQISAGLSPRANLEIYIRSRWKEIPFTETFQNCLQGGLKYRLDPQANALIAYRYDINDKGSYYEFENRFLLQLSYSMPFHDLVDLELAGRTELRYFTRSTEDHIRLRIRSIVSRNLGIFGYTVKPSVSGELFWDSIDNEMNRTRLYTGI